MARKKVTLAYITNDSERKASFKRRKKGVIKKVNEVSTLCYVEACAIIYSQYDPELEVLPSRCAAEAMLNRYRNLSETDRTKKMMNQESLMRQRIKKVGDQVRHAHKVNKQKEMECITFQSLDDIVHVDYLDLHNATEMCLFIDPKLKDIKSKINSLEKNDQHFHGVTSTYSTTVESVAF